MLSPNQGSMHSVLRRIIASYDFLLLNKLHAALNLHVRNYKRDLFPSLKDIDIAIPGAGFQYVIWVGNNPKFPFPGWEFDAIARPMKYIPDFLASGMNFVSIARVVAQSSGGHVEECVKAICNSLTLAVPRYDRLPLGTLAKNENVIKALGTALTGSLSEYADVLVNKAKHQYALGSPEPVISFPDALGGYFASRILGFQVLEKGRILDKYIEAVRQAYSQKIVYVMPDSMDPGDYYVEWPLQSDLSLLREDLEES